MPDTAVTFIDTETTGLEPDRHAIWEVAYIVRRPGEMAVEETHQVQVDLSTADPTALRLNGFYERYDAAGAATPHSVAEKVARATAGTWLVGAVPSFDAGFLDRLLRLYGWAPAWHHRLVCVENLAAGRLGVRAGWDPAKLSEMLGIERPEAEKHTAMGDARWAMLVYDAVFSVPRVPPQKAKAKPDAPKPEPEQPAEAPKPEPEQPTEPEPEVSDSRTVLARLREDGGICEDCKTEVAPVHAVLSYTRHRKVLCSNDENGGCYARYGKVMSA